MLDPAYIAQPMQVDSALASPPQYDSARRHIAFVGTVRGGMEMAPTPRRRGEAPAATPRVSVVLVDDHQLVRAGLRLLLETMPQFEVVAEARDGQEALHQIATQAPAIALLDVSMPGMNGLRALREIRTRYPRTRVLLLSMYDNPEYVTEAIQCGAAGYLLKDAAVDELARALAAVARGETYLSPAITSHVLRAMSAPSAVGDSGELTLRQEQVLRLVTRGHTSKEIALALGLSIKTVETHRNQIMKRLGIHDLAGLVRYAVRSGLIADDE